MQLFECMLLRYDIKKEIRVTHVISLSKDFLSLVRVFNIRMHCIQLIYTIHLLRLKLFPYDFYSVAAECHKAN